MRKISLIIILVLSIYKISTCQELSAKEIVNKSEEYSRGNTMIAQIDVHIIRPTWKKEYSLKVWSIGAMYGMVLIQSPARDQGVSYLKHDREAWNWQPAIEKVIKLPPSMLMQSWMGSDVKNDDLVKQSSLVIDYNHKLVGDTVIKEMDCYKVELLPKEDAPVIWGKIYMFIDKKNYLKLHIKYFDEDGFLVRDMIASEITTIGGRIHPRRIEFIPADNPDYKTVNIYNEIKFNSPLDKSFFTMQNMKDL